MRMISPFGSWASTGLAKSIFQYSNSRYFPFTQGSVAPTGASFPWAICFRPIRGLVNFLALFTSSVKVSVSCDTSSAVLRSSGRGKGLFPRRESLHLRHLACPNSLTEKVNKANFF